MTVREYYNGEIARYSKSIEQYSRLMAVSMQIVSLCKGALDTISDTELDKEWVGSSIDSREVK